MRLTNSLCPECFAVIPAVISERQGAMWMDKRCPAHGPFSAMVERDPFWWYLCDRLNCRNIYDGYVIDVTDRCNLKCKYCFHGNGGADREIEEVIADAEENARFAPFVLSGGEPTIHDHLPELYGRMAKLGDTMILTNGIRLTDDDEFFDEMVKVGLLTSGTLNIGLSFHKESMDRDMDLVSKCREMKIRIRTSFWVIDDLSQIDEAVQVLAKNRDVLCDMRIKAASNIGAESGAKTKIFTSDIINYLKNRGKTDIVTVAPFFNKVSYASVIWEGLFVMPVSWYDIYNIDLGDINCPPWYKAKDGLLYNFVTAQFISQGIEKRVGK